MAHLPSALAYQASRPSRRACPTVCTAKSMMVVVPPQAAARVPVSKVSEAKVPPNGSSMWVCASTPPGMTYLPVASMVRSAVQRLGGGACRGGERGDPAVLDEDVGVDLVGGGDDEAAADQGTGVLMCVLSPRAARCLPCARPARRIAAPSSASATVRRQRRGDAQHAAGVVAAALADEQAALAGRLQDRRRPPRGTGSSVPGSTSSMPIIRPRPRTSRTTPQPGGDGAQPLDEQPADAAGVALEVVLQQVGEVGDAGGHGDRAAAEGRDGVGVQAVHDLGAGDDAADGHAVADALGEGEDVGRAAAGVRLPAPEVVAGTAPAGLHLVGDPQDAVLGRAPRGRRRTARRAVR